jgi:hypothetical protein
MSHFILEFKGATKTVITTFLDNVNAEKFTGLKTLLVSGWEPERYNQLAAMIQNTRLPNLQTFKWKNFIEESQHFPTAYKGELGQDNVLSRCLLSQSFIMTPDPADPTIKVFEKIVKGRML